MLQMTINRKVELKTGPAFLN